MPGTTYRSSLLNGETAPFAKPHARSRRSRISPVARTGQTGERVTEIRSRPFRPTMVPDRQNCCPVCRTLPPPLSLRCGTDPRNRASCSAPPWVWLPISSWLREPPIHRRRVCSLFERVSIFRHRARGRMRDPAERWRSAPLLRVEPLLDGAEMPTGMLAFFIFAIQFSSGRWQTLPSMMARRFSLSPCILAVSRNPDRCEVGRSTLGDETAIDRSLRSPCTAVRPLPWSRPTVGEPFGELPKRPGFCR